MKQKSANIRKPDFFIVGAARCGTTAMKTYLEHHPEVFMPPTPFEPRFFGTDMDSSGSIREEQAYLSLFAAADNAKRVGEKSVLYLYSRRAAYEIKAFQPSARIIIMLRNPVEQIRSWHNFRVYRGSENITNLRDALEAENDRRNGVRLPQGRKALDVNWYLYREWCRYTNQVSRYFDALGKERVHIIIFDDFIGDTQAVYRETLRFLEVDPDFQPDFKRINLNRRPLSHVFQSFLRDPPKPMMRFARALMPHLFRQRVIYALEGLNSVSVPHQPLDPDLKRQLQEEFLPEVERLSELLGRDLTHWCRDGSS